MARLRRGGPGVQAPETLPGPLPRRRLAYDELLAGQIALALMRGRMRARPGRSLRGRR